MSPGLLQVIGAGTSLLSKDGTRQIWVGNRTMLFLIDRIANNRDMYKVMLPSDGNTYYVSIYAVQIVHYEWEALDEIADSN